MKKVILVLVLALLLSLALVACDNTPETPVCDHQAVMDKAVPATCVDTGLTAGAHCSVCDEVLVKQETVGATGIHTPVIDEAVAPTCTEIGLTEGAHCSVCSEILVGQSRFEALGHTVVVDKAVPATCTTSGLTEGKHCSVCDEVLVKQEIIDALGHSYNDEDSCELCINSQFVYELNEDGETYTLVGTTELFEGGDVTIPVMYNGQPITAIGKDAFLDCDSIKSVVISDSIIEIGDYAFGKCSNLTEVTFGENINLTIIPKGCFCETALTTIDIPNSVITIGYEAFGYCEDLTSVNIDKDSQLKYIKSFAFIECISLETFYMPEKMFEIDNQAFYGCDKLREVVFEDTETTWGFVGFVATDALKIVTVDNAEQNADWLTGDYLFADWLKGDFFDHMTPDF